MAINKKKEMINDKISEIVEKYKFNSFDRFNFENKTRRKSKTDVIKTLHDYYTILMIIITILFTK